MDPNNLRCEMSPNFGCINENEICKVCCGRCKNLDVRHIHFSTWYYNKQMSLDCVERPWCYICNENHQIDHLTRKKLLLTSDLAGVQFEKGWLWNDERPVHLDIEGILHGKIPVFKKAWERTCHSVPLPIDTVLVAGLEDIKAEVNNYAIDTDISVMAEEISEKILASIYTIYTLVAEHSDKYNTDDTLAIATLIHTPSMYWRQSDGPLPSSDYRNLKEVIDKTNLKIEAFNLQFGMSNAPKLHQIGERGNRKKRFYNNNAFIESKKEEQFALSTATKFSGMKLITKYFEKGTPRSIVFID